MNHSGIFGYLSFFSTHFSDQYNRHRTEDEEGEKLEILLAFPNFVLLESLQFSTESMGHPRRHPGLLPVLASTPTPSSFLSSAELSKILSKALESVASPPLRKAGNEELSWTQTSNSRAQLLPFRQPLRLLSNVYSLQLCSPVNNRKPYLRWLKSIGALFSQRTRSMAWGSCWYWFHSSLTHQWFQKIGMDLGVGTESWWEERCSSYKTGPVSIGTPWRYLNILLQSCPTKRWKKGTFIPRCPPPHT